jgi:hypothetical protein
MYVNTIAISHEIVYALNMDITKWKSVAIRIKDYKILKAVCKNKFRAPASMISKLVNDYVKFQAGKKGISEKTYVENLLKDN